MEGESGEKRWNMNYRMPLKVKDILITPYKKERWEIIFIYPIRKANPDHPDCSTYGIVARDVSNPDDRIEGVCRIHDNNYYETPLSTWKPSWNFIFCLNFEHQNVETKGKPRTINGFECRAYLFYPQQTYTSALNKWKITHGAKVERNVKNP